MFMPRLIVISNLLLLRGSCTLATEMALKATDFEVFGIVQGVFFRKCTKQQADSLDLRGWCRNTHEGSVQGYIEGPVEKVESMMDWLRNKGSPTSRIDKAEFKNLKDIETYQYDGFSIRR
ncbi:hypothetical protein JYU34_017243 [Plutella xylostella]|uniref:Acylphosphatase n=1 Tax=Plutella xylostella TaxID=51655 RepID=A0ABQ7Q4H8_PLUXY|nr:hypothetical protein JYU34_017243 [Plutella xylostella]